MKKFILNFYILLMVVLSFSILTPLGVFADDSYSVSINGQPSSTTIQDAVKAAGSGETIEVNSNSSKIILPSTLEIENKENLTINLNGATLSGNNQHRVIYIKNSSVSINNGTITDGYQNNPSGSKAITQLTKRNNIIPSIPNTYNVGGGIYIDNTITNNSVIENTQNKVELNNISLINNQTDYGNAIFQNGGILIINSNGNSSSLIKNNSELINENGEIQVKGGVVFICRGEAIINNSEFTENTIAGVGGAGLYITNEASVDLKNSDFIGNTGKVTSAIYNEGTLSVDTCNFNSNYGSFDGVPVKGNKQDVVASKGSITFNECTFSGNKDHKNTIELLGGEAKLVKCKIINNDNYLTGGINSSDTNVSLEETQIIENSVTFDLSNSLEVNGNNNNAKIELVGGLFTDGGTINFDKSLIDQNTVTISNDSNISMNGNQIYTSGGIGFSQEAHSLGNVTLDNSSTVKNNKVIIKDEEKFEGKILSTGGVLISGKDATTKKILPNPYTFTLENGAIYNNQSNNSYKDIYLDGNNILNLIKASNMTIGDDFHSTVIENNEDKPQGNNQVEEGNNSSENSQNGLTEGDENVDNPSNSDSEVEKGEDFLEDAEVTTDDSDEDENDLPSTNNPENNDSDSKKDQTPNTEQQKTFNYYWITSQNTRYDRKWDDESVKILGNSEKPLELTAKKIEDRPIAEYKGQKYLFLEEIFEKDFDINSEIKLLENKDLNNVIDIDAVEISYPVTINLNNCIIGTYDTQAFDVKGNGSLTFIGNGSIRGQISTSSDLTLDGSISEIDVALNNRDTKIILGDNFQEGNVNNIKISLSEDVINSLNSISSNENFPIIDNVNNEILKTKINLSNTDNPNVDLLYNESKKIVVSKKTINGIIVSQNSGETADNIVTTMDDAISKISSYESNPIIYIDGTYTVKENETWGDINLTTPITIKRYSTSRVQNKSSLIKVNKGSNLILTNIKIDGESREPNGENTKEFNKIYSNCGSLIEVADGSLTLNNGTVLANNDVSDKVKSINYDFNPIFFGGAIKATGNSNVSINGGEITNCSAILGGAIYCSGSTQLNMSSGSITYNKAVFRNTIYGNGGAVCILNNCVFRLSGGTIEGNSADQGGGISLGSLNNNVQKLESDLEKPNLIIEKVPNNSSEIEINIRNNESKYSGGGIFVQCQFTADIRDGNFEGNVSKGGNFGGGAIYVNGGKGERFADGIARIYNVHVTENQASMTGAGIAGCGTSNIQIGRDNNSAIYNNTLFETEYSRNGNANDDLALETDNGIVTDFDLEKTSAEADYIPRFMFDGTPYQWKVFETKEYADEDYFLSNKTGKHLYTDKTPSQDSNLESLNVQIKNNTAGYRGGGIGSNGKVFIDPENTNPESFTVTKDFKGYNKSLTDFTNNVDKINIWLIGQKEDSYNLISSQVLYKNNQWSNDSHNVTFEKLPEGYKPVIIEEVIYNDNLHVFSDNDDRQGIIPIVGQIMATYPKEHKFTWAGSYKASFENQTFDDGDNVILINIKSDSPEAKYATISLNGSKVLNGAEINDYNDQFSFSLELVDGNSEGIEEKLPLTVNNNNYNFSFRTITFKEEGSYTFEVKEIKGNDSSIDYDETVYTVIVEVKEVGGKLVAEKTIKVKDENREGIVFVNNKEEEPEEKTSGLTVSKILDSDYSEDYSKLFRFNVYLTSSKLADSADKIQYRIINKKTDRVDKELTNAKLSLVNGQWLFTIDLADGQTVEIVNLPTDTKYQVLEDQQSASGFNSFSTSYQGTVPADGGWAHVAYTNSRRENKEVGSLILQKLVEANNIDQAKQFRFTVTISPKQTGQFGNVYFRDGQATINLRHLESAVISNLPVGTTYTIEEEALDDYTTTWSQAANANNVVSGQITENNRTAFITCTNRKTEETVEDNSKPEMSIVKKQSLTSENYTDQYVQYDEDNNFITYEITVRNTGKVSATNVVITDKVPEGTSLVSGSMIPEGRLVGNTMTWTFNELKAGEEVSVYFTVEVLTGIEQVENTANLTYTEDPPMDSNKVTAGTGDNPNTDTESPEGPSDSENENNQNNQDNTLEPTPNPGTDNTLSPGSGSPTEQVTNNSQSTTTSNGVNKTVNNGTNSSTRTTSVTTESPKTGVIISTGLWITLLGGSAAALTYDKKRKKNK